MRADYIRTTIDRVLCTAPVLLHSVILTPYNTSKRAIITFYDGESAQDDQLIKLLGSYGSSIQFTFNPPLETERGLFVDVVENVGDILVCFAWVNE